MKKLLFVITCALFGVPNSLTKIPFSEGKQQHEKVGASDYRGIDITANKMRNFVIDISRYAKDKNEHFLILPQNGIELCFQNLEPTDGLHMEYLKHIDGLGVESLFPEDTILEENNRLIALQSIKNHKKILVSDYTKNNKNISNFRTKNTSEGFISFPRSAENYDYVNIPETIFQENDKNISSLNDVKNYLYLINYSNFDTKEELLKRIKETNYDLILMDLYCFGEALSQEEILSLKVKKNGGKRLVISYLNIGSAEKFRYYWKSNWKLGSPGWLKKEYEGYADEIWVKFWRKSWKKIIYGNDRSYIQKIIDAGFDGAYLDNVEAYYFVNFD